MTLYISSGLGSCAQAACKTGATSHRKTHIHIRPHTRQVCECVSCLSSSVTGGPLECDTHTYTYTHTHTHTHTYTHTYTHTHIHTHVHTRTHTHTHVHTHTNVYT